MDKDAFIKIGHGQPSTQRDLSVNSKASRQHAWRSDIDPSLIDTHMQLDQIKLLVRSQQILCQGRDSFR